MGVRKFTKSSKKMRGIYIQYIIIKPHSNQLYYNVVNIYNPCDTEVVICLMSVIYILLTTNTQINTKYCMIVNNTSYRD